VQLPNVSNILKDLENDVTYDVIAYRKLSRNEIIQAVRYYNSQKKTKKPKKGTSIKIITIIGYNE
jgi:uncharacterized protein (DUF433 family)